MIRLQNVGVALSLHSLAEGPGHPLLLLHGLGERSPGAVPRHLAGHWDGPVLALDFTGHGNSDIPPGGGYAAESLLGDADTALRHLGVATVLGRGLGGWVAMMLAGVRPEAVRGAIVCDGPGLAGAGALPTSPHVLAPMGGAGPPDPYALAELAREIRPVEYARAFASRAARLSPLATPVAVACVARPPWVTAVIAEAGVSEMPLELALRLYAAAEGSGADGNGSADTAS